MSQFLCEEDFPNWQNFSDWMTKQNCLNPNMLDKYTLLLSGPIHEALTNGELGNKLCDPYENLYKTIVVLKDYEKAIFVLNYVSYFLSKEKKMSTTDEYYEELINWNRAWDIFSVYVKTVVLPNCLDVLIDAALSSDYRRHDFEEYREYNKLHENNQDRFSADIEEAIRKEEMKYWISLKVWKSAVQSLKNRNISKDKNCTPN